LNGQIAQEKAAIRIGKNEGSSFLTGATVRNVQMIAENAHSISTIYSAIECRCALVLIPRRTEMQSGETQSSLR
jgi:hypothetical protein